MITVYCAHCLRPLARELRRVKARTEACIREPVFVPKVSESGLRYLHYDGNGEMQCSTEVVLPGDLP